MSTGALRRARLRTSTVVGLVALLVVVLVVFLAWWNHFKVGLFGHYNAGYASVAPALDADTDQRIALCDTALRTASPELSQPGRVGGVTQDMRAFQAGCETRALGFASNPWVLLSQVEPGKD